MAMVVTEAVRGNTYVNMLVCVRLREEKTMVSMRARHERMRIMDHRLWSLFSSRNILLSYE
jgi:hypothetical protein